MTDPTKDELKATIKELKAKLKEMKGVEQQLTATAEELSQLAIGVSKDEKGNFTLVHVKYDVTKNAAVIGQIEQLNTTDFAIASYKARDTLGEKILRKARGDKYST